MFRSYLTTIHWLSSSLVHVSIGSSQHLFMSALALVRIGSRHNWLSSGDSSALALLKLNSKTVYGACNKDKKTYIEDLFKNAYRNSNSNLSKFKF